MSPVSESEHCKIEAKVDNQYNVVENHEISDPSRGLRRVPVRIVWQAERLIGQGGFAKVYLQYQEGNADKKRALKVIQAMGQKMSDEECRRELLALIEFTKPKYRNAAVFVDFLGWFQDDTAMYLAMEYMPLGDLEHNVKQIEKSPAHPSLSLSEEEVKDISRQILEGLKIMHGEGFAHRDLKPQNVFVVQRQPEWWVKLGDFGLSKKRIEGTAFRTQAGTLQYMAPELFYFVQEIDSETSEYTSAIDLWALGCIIYRILTGAVPFPTLLSLRNHCRDPSKVLLNMPPAMEEAMRFVRDLLMPNPSKRPAASAALEHNWLASIDKPRNKSNDVETRFAELSIFGSQNSYNTVSHMGLQSLRTLPGMRDTVLGSSTKGPASEPLPPTKVGFSKVDKQSQLDRSQGDFVYVKIEGGQSTFVSISQKGTIYDIKKQMQELKGYPIESQILTFKGFQLFNNTTIEHYGIYQGSTINLILGGM